MNDENLIKISTTKEAREKGHNGGVRSGEVRRAKRDAKKCLQLILDTAAKGDKTKQTVNEIMGVDTSDVTNRDVMLARLALNAMQGDMNALKMVLEMAGETPAEKRAEKQEKRAAKAFRVQMNNIEDIDKDNDNVMQYIQGMKKNKVEADKELRAEEEKKHNDAHASSEGGDDDGTT